MSHYKMPVYQILADSRLESDLQEGQIVSRSYSSDIVVKDMGADGSYSTQAITDTAETLTVDQKKEASFYYPKPDEIQAHLPVKVKYGRKLANALINYIDGDVLKIAYQGAGSYLDAADVGGTAGQAITVTQNNVAQMFSVAKQKLMLKNVIYAANARFTGGFKVEQPEGMPIAIISPEVLTYIELYVGGKDTLLGDKTSTNGYSGYFHGFNLFISNSLAWQGTLNFATNPTDGDTIVINGVTLTFKATLGSTAGNVHICSTAAATLTNLVTFLTTPGTTIAEDTDTGAVALSTANQNKLKGFAFTDSTTSMGVVATGWGTIVVSETLTAAADIWTTTSQILHNIFAISKSVSLVIQKNPSLEENFVSSKIGRDYIAWTMFGRKVFVDQAPCIVDCRVNSSSFTAPSSTPL
jgi:hypothetical protein